MKNWNYNKPVFEADKYNYELLAFAPWSGHRNFAYDFVEYFKPEVLVELGSHYGCSAFAFAQGAKDFKLNTKMYFIDTWQGDDFTKKYDNDVFTIFSKTVKSSFADQNINMLRMTFNDALEKFEDKSVDVIHIDGSHHYDDIKEDFENWLPKVKEDGIILLHDISSDIVLGDVMGSYRYWQELQKKFEYTVSFDFSWGLGIIFLDRSKYEDFINNVDLSRYQRNNNALDVEYKDCLRKNYFALKDKEIYINDLLKQKDILTKHLEAYKSDVEKKDKYAEEFEKRAKQEKEDIIKRYSENIEDVKNSYNNTIKGKDDYIAELEEEKEKNLEEIRKLCYKSDELNKKVEELINQNTAVIAERDAFKEAYHKSINYKLSQIKSKFKK